MVIPDEFRQMAYPAGTIDTTAVSSRASRSERVIQLPQALNPAPSIEKASYPGSGVIHAG